MIEKRIATTAAGARSNSPRDRRDKTGLLTGASAISYSMAISAGACVIVRAAHSLALAPGGVSPPATAPSSLSRSRHLRGAIVRPVTAQYPSRIDPTTPPD